MDGGLPSTRQDSYLSGGRFLSVILCVDSACQLLFTPIRDESSKNKVMHELCILGGAHKTKTTPYHPESDGLVERFNRTLLMMLAMFAG